MFKYLILALSFLAFAPMASAGGVIDTYVAHLGVDDHFNSRGERLETVAGIIRQDRANYHKFGKRDALDTGDDFFSSKSNRAIMERMILRGTVTRSARRAILNSTPIIVVQIYRDHVEVALLK